MDCNPYLGIASSLACGYLGMVNRVTPNDEFTGDAYETDQELPQGVNSALELLADAVPLRDVLGEEFCRVYAAVKAAEYGEFLQVISPWEREHLLLNV